MFVRIVFAFAVVHGTPYLVQLLFAGRRPSSSSGGGDTGSRSVGFRGQRDQLSLGRGRNGVIDGFVGRIGFRVQFGVGVLGLLGGNVGVNGRDREIVVSVVVVTSGLALRLVSVTVECMRRSIVWWWWRLRWGIHGGRMSVGDLLIHKMTQSLEVLIV